jgi:hypothetical protein
MLKFTIMEGIMAKRKPSRVEADVPDPARTYERARPEAESLNGRLSGEPSVPSKSPDRMEHAAPNKQALRQLNADDVVNAAGGPMPETDPWAIHRTTRHELAEQRRAQRRNRTRPTR